MVDFSKIKLIIWDLDCTLWEGTVSEENVSLISKNKQFIENLTDIGIVNSICSKNDYDVAEKMLKVFNIWEYFVFPSINWDAKGKRVQNIISTMGLRPANVSFVDDNPQNLKEAEYYCPEIMTTLPEGLIPLYSIAENTQKKDLAHKRLKQYKILEQKSVFKSEFSSNEEFLMSCGIQVKLHDDCEENIERIYDLVQRSNQLNYTKLRHTKEELLSLFADNDCTCGYVTASDKFGDYGIIGFFAVKDKRLVHFTFSCRTLGMRIEQYTYMALGCPSLTINGNVIEELSRDFTPHWINNSQLCATDKFSTDMNILIKGPCDMSQMFSFIEESETICTEFTYVGDNGISVEGHNHTAQIATALTIAEERKNAILADCEWFDSKMLDTAITSSSFNYVVLSMFTDCNLGLYRRKGTNEIISLCEGFYDLTKEENFEKYINKTIFTSNIDFTDKDLQDFAEKYEYVDNSDCSVTIQSLDTIYKKVCPATLVLILPSEKAFSRNTSPSYENRHIIHQLLNNKIRTWSQNKPEVILFPIDKYIHDSKDFTDSISHFTKKVYFELAKDLIETIDKTNSVLKSKSKLFFIKETIKHKVKFFIKKTISLLKK